MRKRRDLQLPLLRAEAELDADSFDAEARTVEIRFYSGAKVEQFSFLEGSYDLKLSLDPKAVRLSALNSGRAPLKSGHSGNSDLSAVFGVIEKAWIDADGARAVARFSARPDVAPYLEDVRSGIIRNVSLEAHLHELEDVTPKGADRRMYLATDWEPIAIALVAIGADPAAHA